ncbi:hypothetical protein ACFQY7_29270 [Actinomadura luteofluorescens]|uniref:hypothetical protein n=1 Tax=Actinomadura luteofluorescens TaxID=46163 RepID=UPI003629BF48
MAAHLRVRAPLLTRRVVARLLAELPVYAELPQEEVAGDIAGIVQHSLRQFADVLERRRPPARPTSPGSATRRRYGPRRACRWTRSSPPTRSGRPWPGRS